MRLPFCLHRISGVMDGRLSFRPSPSFATGLHILTFRFSSIVLVFFFLQLDWFIYCICIIFELVRFFSVNLREMIFNFLLNMLTRSLLCFCGLYAGMASVWLSDTFQCSKYWADCSLILFYCVQKYPSVAAIPQSYFYSWKWKEVAFQSYSFILELSKNWQRVTKTKALKIKRAR